MGAVPETPFKPKKSVALSEVAAGNTALCAVGRTGCDLHYLGYDILDLAGLDAVVLASLGRQWQKNRRGLVARGKLKATLINAGIPTIFVNAADIGYAGADCIQFEDQVSPKRCGHFTGKDVIATDEAVNKITGSRSTPTPPCKARSPA